MYKKLVEVEFDVNDIPSDLYDYIADIAINDGQFSSYDPFSSIRFYTVLDDPGKFSAEKEISIYQYYDISGFVDFHKNENPEEVKKKFLPQLEMLIEHLQAFKDVISSL